MVVYQIQLRSPMGIKRGAARVFPRDGRITLTVLGGDNLFSGEFTSQNEFQMSGTLKTALYDLPASLRGRLSEGAFHAVLTTEKGAFPIEGKRLEGGDGQEAVPKPAARMQKG